MDINDNTGESIRNIITGFFCIVQWTVSSGFTLISLKPGPDPIKSFRHRTMLDIWCWLKSEGIGRNNRLQTLFQTHSNILSNCNWFRWMVVESIIKLVETITSKHYFKLIPILCQIVTGFDEWSSKALANWLKQSPPNIISNSFLYYVKLEEC